MVVSNSVLGSNTLKFDDVVSVILSEEMRRKRTSETLGNALTMDSKRRQRVGGRSPHNHNKSIKGRSKSIFKNIECQNCGKRGHMKKDKKYPKNKGDG